MPIRIPTHVSTMFKLLLGLALGVQAALANVEKTIFIAPPTVNIPLKSPSLDDLHIDVLTPSDSSLRTYIDVRRGTWSPKMTWILLDELTVGQRYELRVCWAASSKPHPAIQDSVEDRG